MTTVPLIEVRGNRRELGRQHGEACREHIRGYAALLATLLARDGSNQLPGVRQRRSPDELARRALRFLPATGPAASVLAALARDRARGDQSPSRCRGMAVWEWVWESLLESAICEGL